MGDSYETLAELCDRADNLSCRLHVMIDTYSTEGLRPDVLFDKDIERARKQICSNYTTVMDGATLAAKKWLALFKDRAPKIAAELSDDFRLLQECYEFRTDACAVLTSTLKASMDFQLGINTDLTEKLLGLVTAYVKLHLLLDPRFHKQSELGPQDVVILYQTAVKCTQRMHDADTNQLKGYLQLFCNGEALRSVKDDMHEVSEAVGGYLLNLHDLLLKLMDPQTSTQQIVSSAAFSLVDRLDRLGMPVDTLEGHLGAPGGGGDGAGGGTKRLKNYYKSARFYLDATYLSRMREWVFFGLLACPSVLQGEKAMELLKLVASDGWLVRVYRDKVLDMHEVWEDHFKFLKTGQKTAGKYHGKAKDHMYNIERQAMSHAAKFHAVRRTFLRNVLPQFLKILKQCPGVLGPQYPVLLALLSLARAELEFYYLHRRQVPRKGGQVHKGWGAYPKHEPGEWEDPKIIVLLSLAEEMRHFCQSHHAVVAEYFALCLKDVHGAEVAATRECLNARKITQDDMEVCVAALQSASPKTDFLELRSAWHRCASKINDGWNPPERVRTAVHRLQVVMDLATRHSRYVDMQAQVHATTTSLSQLWWHASGVVEDFQERTLNNDNRFNVDATWAVGGVRLFNAAAENSHPKVPADRAAIGEASVQFARHMLKLICRRVAAAVRINNALQVELDLCTASPDVEAHVQQSVVYRNTDALHYLCRLAKGFALLPSVVVFHTELIPRLYLREVLSADLKLFILGDPKRSRSHGLVQLYAEEPGRIFSALNTYLGVLGKACDLANVQHTSLVREVLREQVGSVGASIDARASVMLSDGATLVSQLSDSFVRYIQHAVSHDVVDDGKHMATYCPIYEGFVSVGIRGKREKRQTFLQTQFSVRGLSDLMGLIGPTGVRFVQANLLEKVFKPAVKRLIQIVHRNNDAIPQLEKAVAANSPAALGVACSMVHLDEFMDSLGTVSVLLAFRAMLYAALARAGEKTPIIQQFCRLATRGVEFEVSSESMDLVSQACGVEPVADYLMQDALAAARGGVLKSVGGGGPGGGGAALQTLGKSFAVLAAAAYTTPGFWDTKVRLETQLGVFNNNAHLFGPTLVKLACDITALEQSAVGRGPGSGTGAGLAGATAKQMAAGIMKQHFRTAADLLLRMKEDHEGRVQRHMPLQAMTVALQMTVDSAAALVNGSFFEGIVPYKYVHFCWADVVRGRLGTDARSFPPKMPEELMYFE